MIQLKAGDKAPAIDANVNGKHFTLESLKGKKIVLYFYPKDDTSGCTAEACNLKEFYADFLQKGFEVIGVSPDSEASHQKFSTKYELPFMLIPDEDLKIIKDYGVWGEKSMYGKKYMGVMRTTFIIDENGMIEKMIEKVKTKEHSQQIFKELKLN